MSDSDGFIEGGDPVCWVDQLCPECRAMPSPESAQRCWRCGGPLEPAGERPDRRVEPSDPGGLTP